MGPFKVDRWGKVVEEHLKTQEIRLMDVLILGPFMIWAGLQTKQLPDIAKLLLIGAGIGTVIYNGNNYLKIQQGG